MRRSWRASLPCRTWGSPRSSQEATVMRSSTCRRRCLTQLWVADVRQSKSFLLFYFTLYFCSKTQNTINNDELEVGKSWSELVLNWGWCTWYLHLHFLIFTHKVRLDGRQLNTVQSQINSIICVHFNLIRWHNLTCFLEHLFFFVH